MTAPYTGASIGSPTSPPKLQLGQQPTMPNVNTQSAQPMQFDSHTAYNFSPPTGGATGTPTPTQPQTLGAGASYGPSFGPGNNLIGTQINATDSTRTQGASGYTDAAASGLAGYKQPTLGSVPQYDPSGVLSQLGQYNQNAQGMSYGGYQPVAGTDLTGARQQLGMASNAAGGSNAYTGMGQTGGFGYGGDTTQVRAMGLDQLNKTLNTTPDRAALASSAFNRIASDSLPDFQNTLRQTGAANAALGRRGSGLMTSNLADVQDARNKYLASQQGQLADNAAGLSLQDQAAKLSAAQGFGQSLAGMDTAAGGLNLGYQNSNNQALNDAFGRSTTAQQNAFGNRLSLANANANFGQIARQDATQERDANNAAQQYGNQLTAQKAGLGRQYAQDQYGIGQDQYSNALNERNAQYNAGQQGFQNQIQSLSALQGNENNSRNIDANAQNAARGERGYQYGLSQDAQAARERQNAQQEQQYQQGFGNAVTQANLGYGQSPYDAQVNQANRLDGQASDAMGAGAQLLGQFGMNRGSQQPGQPSVSAGQQIQNAGYLGGLSAPAIQDALGAQGPQGPASNIDPSVIARLLGGGA